MINLANNKGITIYSLIITVAVLVTIAGTATYTAMDVYQEAKEEAFIQKLQIIQNAVNNEVSKIEVGQKKYSDYIIDVNKIDEEGFIEYTANEIETKFGITGITQDLKINLITKEVKSVNPINIDGMQNYSLSDMGLINQVVSIDDNKLLNRYVQEGLILHVDGINNSGEGHDLDYKWIDNGVTKYGWKDLVTGENIEVNGNTSGKSIWSEKAFLGHGTEYFKISLPELYSDGSGTVETLLKSKNAIIPDNSVTKYTAIGKFQGGTPGYGSFIYIDNRRGI